MDYDALVKFVQEQFTDGLALVIGSGLSAAEGLPGMAALADNLRSKADELTGTEATIWSHINAALDANSGLEAALLKHAPSDALEVWIARVTTNLLMPKEREVISKVLRGDHT